MCILLKCIVQITSLGVSTANMFDRIHCSIFLLFPLTIYDPPICHRLLATALLFLCVFLLVLGLPLRQNSNVRGRTIWQKLSKSFGFVRESLIVNMRYCHTNHKTLQVIANTVQVSLSVCHVTFIIVMVSVSKFVRDCNECRKRLLILDPSPSPLDLNSLEDIVSFLG